MALPQYLINPRDQQPGNRQSDLELQQIKIRMGKLEKRLGELEVMAQKRGPGRPRKEVA